MVDAYRRGNMLYPLLAGGRKVQGEKYTFKGGDMRPWSYSGGIPFRSPVQPRIKDERMGLQQYATEYPGADMPFVYCAVGRDRYCILAIGGGYQQGLRIKKDGTCRPFILLIYRYGSIGASEHNNSCRHTHRNFCLNNIAADITGKHISLGNRELCLRADKVKGNAIG